MFKRLIAAALSAAAIMVVGAAPTLAQTQPDRSASATGTPNTERVQPGRINEGRQNNRRGRPAAAPTPEQNKAAADALIAATGSSCQTTEVVLRGQIGEGQNAYEVACATGPGLVLIGSTPPQAVDCIALFGQAEIARATDPDADVGLQCQIEANKDILKVMRQFASEAGLTCTVDQGSAVGKSEIGGLVYEIGCTGMDGYRIEKAAAGWTRTSCFEILSANGRCRYTTAEEQSATLKGWLAGSAASACDVTGARYMGANANGAFYEAKCAAGEGYIARFNAEKAVQQIYPCAEAQLIGGGCKLTTVPAAVAPASAPATQP